MTTPNEQRDKAFEEHWKGSRVPFCEGMDPLAYEIKREAAKMDFEAGAKAERERVSPHPDTVIEAWRRRCGTSYEGVEVTVRSQGFYADGYFDGAKAERDRLEEQYRQKLIASESVIMKTANQSIRSVKGKVLKEVLKLVNRHYEQWRKDKYSMESQAAATALDMLEQDVEKLKEQ